MKSKHQLYIINSLFFIGMILVAVYYIYMDQNYSTKKPIDDEKRLALELRLPFLPKDSAVHSYYKEFIKDDVLSKAEYVTLIDLEQKYLNSMGSETTADNTVQKSDLELERENLEAFDRIGAQLLPPKIAETAREAIVSKIDKLEAKEKAKLKPN